jgi:hypothetical protein
MVVTDVFRRGAWKEDVPMTFNDGTTNPPPDLPPVDLEMNYIGWPLRGLGLYISFVLMTLAIGFLVWTAKNRMNTIVKASQPMFLYTICAGCFLMGSTIIFSSIDDEIASQDVCSAPLRRHALRLLRGLDIGLFCSLCQGTGAQQILS